ncbi:MAG: response regulator [Candidatus Adiutricales bacterium]
MKIMIVDDEKKIADAMTERLRIRGFDAAAVYSGRSALQLLRKETFDGIVLDLRLPDIDGIEVLKRTMKEYPKMKVVILSGHGTDQEFQRCLKRGAKACFHKPANLSKITNVFYDGYMKDDKDI